MHYISKCVEPARLAGTNASIVVQRGYDYKTIAEYAIECSTRVVEGTLDEAFHGSERPGWRLHTVTKNQVETFIELELAMDKNCPVLVHIPPAGTTVDLVAVPVQLRPYVTWAYFAKLFVYSVQVRRLMEQALFIKLLPRT